VLVMHGDDDQIVPYVNAGVQSARLLQNSALKIYPGFSHGMPTTNADTINADLRKIPSLIFFEAAKMMKSDSAKCPQNCVN
jgi:pimeloyl-ACP methyl ester carboxylesterase